MANLGLLEEILVEAGDSVLRVRFVAGDIWQLNRFTVAQDMDEDSPHGTATVVHLVNVAEDKRRLFKEGSGLFFMLRDVGEVTEADGGRVLFSTETIY